MGSIDAVQKFATEINRNWHKTTEHVLETARLCAEADKNLRSSEKSKLYDALDFNKATFSKLVKIGKQKHLHDEKVKPMLPPNYTVVYELAKLSEEDLGVAIRDKVVNPNMTRGELDAWLSERKGNSPEATKERVIATVCVPSDFDEKKEAMLEAALDALRTEFGIEVRRPRDQELDALNSMARKIDDYIRKGARRYIRSLKAKKLGGKRHLSPAARKQLWSYSQDEVEIRPDASWEEVQCALDTVGAGDQFERLRDEAFRLHGVSEKTLKKHPPVNQAAGREDLREVVEEFYASLPKSSRDRRRPPLDFSGVH